MDGIVELSPADLAVAAGLVVALAALSIGMRLGLARSILIAAARTTVQLLIIGWILRSLFESVHPFWVASIAFVMLAVAGHEVMARQKKRLAGAWGYGVGSFSMFLSAFTVTLFALAVVIGPEPWYTPRYAIPLLGMMLGNSMNGVALGVDHLTSTVSQRRPAIEARLLLGHDWNASISAFRRDAIRVGMIPIINAMAAAGIVSLPGMMTGQILAGASPVDAVKYQILIMFMVASITGFGTALAVWLTSRRLFDQRQRLRLDRLKT